MLPLINKKSGLTVKAQMQAPRKITIPPHVASISEDNYSILDIPKDTIDAACRYLIEQGAIWGDVAFFASTNDYRNTGCFMFDGNTLVDLHTDLIDYGSVPPPFFPIECGLPTNYWSGVIQHNGLVPIKTSTIRDNLIASPRVGNIPGNGMTFIYFKFEYNGTTYTVVTEVDGCVDPQKHAQYICGLITDEERPFLMFNWLHDHASTIPNVLWNCCYIFEQ